MFLIVHNRIVKNFNFEVFSISKSWKFCGGDKIVFKSFFKHEQLGSKNQFFR